MAGETVAQFRKCLVAQILAQVDAAHAGAKPGV
jgi:hypothetical protein